MVTKLLLAGLLGALPHIAGAYEVKFCTDVKGNDCPIQVTDVGSGGADHCEVYDSKATFDNQGFEQDDDGNYHPYMKVRQPDENCRVVLLMPAGVDMEGCGIPDQSVPHADVRHVTIHDNYMVTFCCGADCGDLGVQKREPLLDDRDDRNHTSTVWRGDLPMEPVEVGPPVNRRSLEPRDDDDDEGYTECDGNWQPDDGQSEFIANSNDHIVVAGSVSGSGSTQVTSTRSQSWTKQVETNAGISFEGVLSLGISMSESITKETSQSASTTANYDKGQTGQLVFTPKLKCTTGQGTCGGEKVRGTFCTGYKINHSKNADVAGTYHVVDAL